jgi:hypothetical protein
MLRRSNTEMLDRTVLKKLMSRFLRIRSNKWGSGKNRNWCDTFPYDAFPLGIPNI